VAASLRDLAVVEAMGAAGQREEALRLVEQIRLRVMPTPRVLLPLALVQLHLGAPRDAALTMSFAFFLSGPSPEAMQVQAQIHVAEGQVEQAVAAAAAADELAGGSAASRTFLARLLYSVGRRAEACEVLTAAGPARAELGATARTFGCSR
jgi:predicted Zn-dependent protease